MKTKDLLRYGAVHLIGFAGGWWAYGSMVRDITPDNQLAIFLSVMAKLLLALLAGGVVLHAKADKKDPLDGFNPNKK